MVVDKNKKYIGTAEVMMAHYGHPSCQQCPFATREFSLRYRCTLSFEILCDVQNIGRRCPITWVEAKEEEE